MLLTCMLLTFSVSSKEVVTSGGSFNISEKDALDELMDRVAKADPKEIFKTDRDKWSIWHGTPLPRTQKLSKTRFIPWYTQPRDVTGPNGIIYPKGFVFNPLEYAQTHQRYFFFKLDQIDALKSKFRASDVLIADSGDVVEAGVKHKLDIYMIEPEMTERMGVKTVPSIIQQKGKYFEILAFPLSKE